MAKIKRLCKTYCTVILIVILGFNIMMYMESGNVTWTTNEPFMNSYFYYHLSIILWSIILVVVVSVMRLILRLIIKGVKRLCQKPKTNSM